MSKQTREKYPSDDFTSCPKCGVDDLCELSPCHGIHLLSQYRAGEPIDAAWTTHTDMTAGFVYCRSCGAEWDWNGNEEVDYG